MNADERRERKRAYNREWYRRHNQHRLGRPRGPAPGAVKALDEAAMRDRLEAFREGEELARARLSPCLPATCEFCLHQDLEVGLLQRQHCVLDRVPGVTGGCDRWQPRYRTRDEEEECQHKGTEGTDPTRSGASTLDGLEKGRAA